MQWNPLMQGENLAVAAFDLDLTSFATPSNPGIDLRGGSVHFWVGAPTGVWDLSVELQDANGNWRGWFLFGPPPDWSQQWINFDEMDQNGWVFYEDPGFDLWSVTGIRFDDNEAFRDTTTWRTAASLPLAELGIRPHASVGTAVKLPTMFEQFWTDQFFSPNPNLLPERSFGWDAGIEFTLLGGRAAVDVTYFRADLTDKIDGFVPTGVPGVFTAANLPGKSTREGVEIAARVRLASNLTWGAAYTFTDARNPDGQEEVRRPPHSARTDLSYTFAGGRGSASLAVLYNGRMEDIAFVLPFFDPQLRVGLDPYWAVNAAASYKLQPGVELFARVENLLDQKYQESFGFEAAPIAAFGGIKFTLGGPDGFGGSWAR